MKLSVKQVEELYEQALNVVKQKPPEFFNLRKMHGTVGLCYYTDIELDYRRDIIPTAFHEIFHFIYPKWTESEVKYAESRIINVCSPAKIATFMKHLSDKIYKNEIQKLTPKNTSNSKKRKMK